MLLILLGLLILGLAALWLARKPLATRYADRFLAEKGVPARYRVADLGFGRQRLVDVVLGDPRNPDLVADWLEARTAVGLSGPYLTGVRGGHVRVRARLTGGKLSFGSIDRLLPKGDPRKPFALPALTLDVDDLRARVETPFGIVGAKLSGRGPLDGGFDGRLAVTAARLGDACRVTGPRLAARVTTRADAVRLETSGEIAGAACGGASAGYANVNGSGEVGLGRAVTWKLDADLAARSLRHPLVRAARAGGRVQLAGGLAALRGAIDWSAHDMSGRGIAARTVTLRGGVSRDPVRHAFGFYGRAGWQAAHVSPARLRAFAGAGQGTPLAPLIRQAMASLTRAAAAFDGGATLVASVGDRSSLHVTHTSIVAASGARATLTGDGLAWTPTGGLRVAGSARVAGGGLPTADIRFDPTGPGELRGVATVRPYAVGDARLALTPTRFVYGRAGWQVNTTATLSGPLAGGRAEAVTLPIDARGVGGVVTLGNGCVPVGWRQIAVSGLVLDRGGVRLCAEGGALVSLRDGRLAGAARLGTIRLTGRLGTTPLTLAAGSARLRLGEHGFAIQTIAARLGQPGRISRLDLASIEGRLTPVGIAGRFTGGAGQIGVVPLLLSEAVGTWRFANGSLAVDGGLTVSDAQADRPRLRPLPVRDVALSLRGNAVQARGTVRSPDGARTVATVQLTHDLRAGAGRATFAVPNLVFDKALQPDQLTPVTFGVVADVRGTVTGDGRIDWSPAGVTSTGTFATQGTDLAAAFGPVQGVAGTIRFTDLLALQSAPGQVFTVREVNPGIAVTDGTVTFQTLPNARVAVAGARWPFAGGTLTLEPTLLDFAGEAQRRMTFRVTGAATDQFLQQFDFKNLDATGIFDGELPIVFDQAGGRIENGRLQVRPGGGTIAYVGAITQKDIGFWPNLAFQALKSLRYRSLNITMNGPLAGEMVTEVRFAGISQGEGAARGGIAGLLVGRLQRLPFVFNIRIRAPFRGLLDSTASFYDPRRLIQRNLPQLIEEQNKRSQPPQGGQQARPPAKPVQPPASEFVP